MKLLHAQEPGWGPYGKETNTSWLTALEESFAPGKPADPRGSPYVFGPGYSQVPLGHCLQ